MNHIEGDQLMFFYHDGLTLNGKRYKSYYF
jgi:hypothetical protein